MLWVNDANGNIGTVARHDRDGHPYDAMNYGYHTDAIGRKLRNRPYNIQDLADQDGDYAQDIPQMAYQPNDIVDQQDANHTINTANNFSYDVLGQRTKDEKADIELIEWTASGKMKRIQRTAASGKPDITFAYDGAGNRILKQVGDPDVDPAGYREHYVLDAQGNIMAIYRSQPEPVPNTSPQQYAASLKVVERPVYGSKRLGSYTRTMELVGESPIINYPYTQPMQAPLKRYELTDHLGNVATVVTGRLLPLLGPGVQYQAEVVSAGLHEPFGLELTGMNWQSDVSRFGFQNQIKDLEMNAIHFKYREYSPAYGVFSSIDPLWAKYPWNSPYAFSENRVVDSNELEGLESIPGGQIVTTDDLLAPAKLTVATESTVTPLTEWDSKLRLPESKPSSPMELVGQAFVGTAVMTEGYVRNTASTGVLLATSLLTGAEVWAKGLKNALTGNSNSPQPAMAPYTLRDNWTLERRESLMDGILTPSEGAEVVDIPLMLSTPLIPKVVNTKYPLLNKLGEEAIGEGATNLIHEGLESLDDNK